MVESHFDRSELLSAAQYEAYRDYVLHDIPPIITFLDRETIEVMEIPPDYTPVCIDEEESCLD